MNIPIYRAKRIDSNEYVEGFLTKCRVSYFIESGSSHCDEIDTTTLSIHFPDMLDSEGKKIFASLSEDGKGGDIMKSYEHYFSIYGYHVDVENTVLIENGCYKFDNTAWEELSLKKHEVIGIQD